MALVALLNHAYIRRYLIPFLNARVISARGVGNFATKLVAMATSLEESEKLDWIDKIHANTFHLVKKIVKIGPVDTKIALLIVKKIKKKEINASKIYGPVGRFAERAK